MTFTARSARASGVFLRVGVLSALFGLQLVQPVMAGDGSVSETVVWDQPGHDVVVTYSRDRDGVGSLRFRELQTRRTLSVAYLVESNKDLVANLSFAGMQHFNGMLVVALESTSNVIVEVFTYDGQGSVTEVANTAGRWMPELMYVGDQADPAIGILRQTANSKGRQPGLICGEKIYAMNQRTRRIEESAVRWTARGREAVPKLDAACTD